MMFSRKLVLAATVALSLTGSIARADVISTLPSWTGSVGSAPATGNNYHSWGVPNGGTPTYGETFTVPVGDTTLSSLQVEVATLSGAPIGFKLYIYAWNGSATTGSAVYSGSGSIADSSGNFENVTSNLTGTTVTPGSTYVFYYTTAGTGDAAATAAFGAIFPATAAGNFVFNNDPNVGNNAWNTGPASLAFSLTLSPSASVPEPSTWALLTVGTVAACGGALRRRNHKASATV
jgi:hypothetical protein